MVKLIESELAEIANKVKVNSRKMRSLSKTALVITKETGDLLIAAKSKIEHGKFGRWIADNCDITARYAQISMKIAENWALIEDQMRNDFAFETINDAIQYIRDRKSDDTKTRIHAGFEPDEKPAEPEQAETVEEPESRMTRTECGSTEKPEKTSESAKVAEFSERSGEADPVDEIMALIAKLNTRERDKLMERLDPPDQSDPELHAVMGETAHRLSLADPKVKAEIDEALELEYFGEYPGIAVQWILDALDGDCEDVGLLIGEARIRFAVETLSSDAVVALGYLALGAVQPNLDLSGVIDCTALEEIFGQKEPSDF